jgi:hypothetical protein
VRRFSCSHRRAETKRNVLHKDILGDDIASILTHTWRIDPVEGSRGVDLAVVVKQM